MFKGGKWLLVILVVLLVSSMGLTTVAVADLVLQSNLDGACDYYWYGHCCGPTGGQMLYHVDCNGNWHTECTGVCPY